MPLHEETFWMRKNEIHESSFGERSETLLWSLTKYIVKLVQILIMSLYWWDVFVDLHRDIFRFLYIQYTQSWPLEYSIESFYLEYHGLHNVPQVTYSLKYLLSVNAY